MLRTIDSDALAQRILRSREQTPDRMIPVGAVLQMIEDAPTVYYQIKGGWKQYGPQLICGCGWSRPSKSNFCPMCGKCMINKGGDIVVDSGIEYR